MPTDAAKPTKTTRGWVVARIRKKDGLPSQITDCGRMFEGKQAAQQLARWYTANTYGNYQAARVSVTLELTGELAALPKPPTKKNTWAICDDSEGNDDD